jgi:sugar phosphate isomerase/epimerase
MFKNLNASALGVTGHQSEIIELALSFGFGGMDLSVVEFAIRVKLKGLEYAKRLFVSGKLRLGSFSLPVAWDADDATFQKDMKKLPEYAQAAASAGCTRAVAVLAPAAEKRPYHENFELHRQRFQDICRVLQPAGICLGLGFRASASLRKNQPFEFIHDLDALLQLINMIGAANVGLLLDTWEVAVAGGTAESIRKVPVERIVAVQFADVPAEGVASELEETSRLLPGAEGSRNELPAILTYLKQGGYDGPVTPLPARTLLLSRRRDLVIRQVGDALDKVWRVAGLPSERKFVASAATNDYRDDHESRRY